MWSVFILIVPLIGRVISCNVDLVATTDPQNITSPNYPGNYSNNFNCFTYLRSPPDTVIELHFYAFDLEDSWYCIFDSLVVWDGINGSMNLLQHSCGQSFVWPRFPDTVVSTENAMTLHFSSDSSISYTGFSASFRYIEPRPYVLAIAYHQSQTIHVTHRRNMLGYFLEPEGAINILAVDFDPLDQYLYFTDAGTKTISKALFTQKPIVLHDDNIQYPMALRIDVVARLLYWTDADLGAVFASDLDGRNRRLLISINLDKPGSIVTDPYEGYIYFTDWGSSPKIERAEADGSARTVLVRNNILSPKALTIDLTEKMLYWMDSELDTLDRVTVDGSFRERVQTFKEHNALSLALDGDAFFFSHQDPMDGALYLMDRVTLDITGIIIDDLQDLHGITLRPFEDFGDIQQYSCPRADCEGLCLPKPSRTFTCLKDPLGVICPDNIQREVADGVYFDAVNWDEPKDGEGLSAYNSTHKPGYHFPAGKITTVIYDFYKLNIHSQCTFTITINVVDETPPLFINCPSFINAWVTEGQTSTRVFWDEIIFEDPDAFIFSETSDSGSVFYLGDTNVYILASDTSDTGNQACCNFTVTVQVDETPPLFINCPSFIIAWVTESQTPTLVSWDEIALENPEDFIISETAESGSVFFLGDTNVYILASDTAGNKAWCNFTVTVQGQNDPLAHRAQPTAGVLALVLIVVAIIVIIIYRCRMQNSISCQLLPEERSDKNIIDQPVRSVYLGKGNDVVALPTNTVEYAECVVGSQRGPVNDEGPFPVSFESGCTKEAEGTNNCMGAEGIDVAKGTNAAFQKDVDNLKGDVTVFHNIVISKENEYQMCSDA